ncbi:MAG: manganese efflux pump MntP family protein [Clostridiaceae bacterium]
MDIYTLLLIAVALSLDAFGVALSIGITGGIKRENKIMFALSFGFFQFLFSLLGAIAGNLFTTYIVSIPKLIGGAIVAIVGILMLKEGMEEKEEKLFVNKKMYAILGISVSIDALIIGFTMLNQVKSEVLMFVDCLIIGVVALIFSALAFILSKHLKKISVIESYADYIGGIILILFGLKMIFF